MTMISEFARFLAALAVLGVAGAWFCLLFQSRNPRLLFAAPLVGLAVLPMPVMFLYSFFQQSFGASIVIGWGLLATASLGVLVVTRPPIDWAACRPTALVAFGLAVLIFAAVNAATLSGHGVAVLIMDGSDQLGYSHVGDWFLNHPVDVGPQLSADRPYDSWPYNGTHEGRFGAYMLAAATTVLTGRSALFSFDLSCAVVLTAGVIGVAAVHAGRSWSFPLLALGLAASLWFDLGRTGYFGKILAYPLLLLYFGLIRDYVRQASGDRAILLVVLLLGMSTTFNYLSYVSAIVMVLIGATATLALTPALGRIPLADLRAGALQYWRLLTLSVAGALVLFGSVNELNVTWVLRLPESFDLPAARVALIGWDFENHGVVLSALNAWGYAPVVVALVIGALIGLVAARQRELMAGALILGPLALFLLMDRGGQKWTLYQLGGVLYPFTLVGAVVVAERLARDAKSWRQGLGAGLVVVAALALIGARVPRLLGAIDRYATDAPASQRFQLRDIERIREVAGAGPVLIQVAELLPAVVATVEFGRTMPLQFGPEAWQRVVGSYRGWPHAPATAPATVALLAPTEPVPPGMREVFTNAQYRVVAPGR